MTVPGHRIAAIATSRRKAAGSQAFLLGGKCPTGKSAK